MTIQVLFNNESVLPSNITFNPAITQSGTSLTTDFPNSGNVTVTMTAINGIFAHTPTIYLFTPFTEEPSTIKLNDDSTVVTWTYYISRNRSSISRIEYSNIEIIETPITGLTNFITYYHVNDDILNELSQEAIYVRSSDGQTVDLTTYITTLRSYPFEISSRENIAIRLGAIATTVKAPIIDTFYHEIDFGTITIGSTNNNVNDFSATYKIMLPFIGLQAVDAQWYANQIVNLKYEIDLKTGLFIAITAIGQIPIDVFTGQIGVDIPYKLSSTSTVSNIIDTSIQTNYPLEASFIILYHANFSNDVVSRTDMRYEKIENVDKKGLVVFNDVILVNTIPNNLQSEIISLLTSGIII